MATSGNLRVIPKEQFVELLLTDYDHLIDGAKMREMVNQRVNKGSDQKDGDCNRVERFIKKLINEKIENTLASTIGGNIDHYNEQEDFQAEVANE